MPVMGYWKLPSGWEWRALQELAGVGHAGAAPADNVLYDIAGDPWSQPEERPAPGDAQICDEHCVLIGQAQKQFKVVVPSRAGYASAQWLVLRPKPGLDRDYLAWYLRALPVLAAPATWKRGLSRTELGRLQVAIPVVVDAAEAPRVQRRIAAHLARQIQEWREAYRLAGAIQRDASTLVAAAIYEVFTSPASAEWPVRKLGHLAHLVPGPVRKSSPDPDHPRFLDVGGITDAIAAAHIIRWDNLERWKPAGTNRLKDLLLREGDALFERSGNTTGRMFRLTAPPPSAVCSGSIIALRSCTADCDQGFVYWLMRSPSVQQQVAARKQGRSTPLLSVNGEELQGIDVRLPPPVQQQRLMTYLDGIEAQALRMLGRQRQAVQLLEQLAGALYHAAFMGTGA